MKKLLLFFLSIGFLHTTCKEKKSTPIKTTTAASKSTWRGSTYEVSDPYCGAGLESAIMIGDSYFVSVANAPSSRTVRVNDKYYTNACSSYSAKQIGHQTNEDSYIAQSGSISRSGNTISFTALMRIHYKLLHILCRIL